MGMTTKIVLEKSNVRLMKRHTRTKNKERGNRWRDEGDLPP